VRGRIAGVSCGAAYVPGTGGPGLGAEPLCVLLGGGPPARRPRRERRSARRLEARPGPAAAHQHCGQALPQRVSHRAVDTLLWF